MEAFEGEFIFHKEKEDGFWNMLVKDFLFVLKKDIRLNRNYAEQWKPFSKYLILKKLCF